MTTFVLVHGGFADSHVWRDTAAALRADGHTVVAPDLPGNGTDPAGLGDLATDTAVLRREIDGAARAAGGRVVLVGHSSGGVVLTEVADHPALARTVFIAAFRPRRGQAMVDVTGADPLPWWRVHPSGVACEVVDDPELTRRELAPAVDPERWRGFHDRLLLCSTATTTTPVTAPDRTHPATYVVCTHDGVVPVPAQEAMAADAEAVLRIGTGHMPQVEDPEGLARLLVGAAESTRTPA